MKNLALPLGCLFFGSQLLLQAIYFGLWLFISGEKILLTVGQFFPSLLLALGIIGFSLSLIGQMGLKILNKKLSPLFIFKLSSDLFVFFGCLIILLGSTGMPIDEEGSVFFRIIGLVIYVMLCVKMAVAKAADGTKLFYWMVPSLLLGPIFMLAIKWKWVLEVFEKEIEAPKVEPN